jgi:hypothetical protein
MFNRTLQVKMVKSNKEEPTTLPQSNLDLEEAGAIVSHYFGRAFEKIVVSVIAYVVVDTIRQVMIARANRS